MLRCHIVPRGHSALYLKETHYVVGHSTLSKIFTLIYCITLFTERMFTVNSNLV